MSIHDVPETVGIKPNSVAIVNTKGAEPLFSQPEYSNYLDYELVQEYVHLA